MDIEHALLHERFLNKNKVSNIVLFKHILINQTVQNIIRAMRKNAFYAEMGELVKKASVLIQ